MDDNKKKIAFIINPISGTQGKEHILKWLDEKLDKNRYMPEVIYTEWAGERGSLCFIMSAERSPMWSRTLP